MGIRQIEASCLDALKLAKTQYVLRVRIRSSNQSYKFLNVVWEAVGRPEGRALVPAIGSSAMPSEPSAISRWFVEGRRTELGRHPGSS